MSQTLLACFVVVEDAWIDEVRATQGSWVCDFVARSNSKKDPSLASCLSVAGAKILTGDGEVLDS